MKAVLYVKKEKPKLYITDKGFVLTDFELGDYFNNKVLLSGKIVAECDFEVEEIFEDNLEDARDGYVEHFYTLKSYDDFDEGENVLLKESCLQKHELSNYLGFENGYAIHIKNLHIFDKPKELSEYYRYCPCSSNPLQPIKVAPQNMMYAYYFKNCGENPEYTLISIHPQWLCKILNGEKTIEVRKKVLKGVK